MLIPVLELFLMIYLGMNIGILYTFTIIASTSFFGMILIKNQGLTVIRDFRSILSRGQIPGNEILNGLIVLIGAILLLTPGLITDFFGLLLLLPWSRKIFHHLLKAKLFTWIMKGRIRIY